MSNSVRTYLVGLAGRGIGSSRSPEMHEREAAALGMPLVYRLVDFDRLGYDDHRLDETVRTLQAIGFDGINVTHPFKQRVLASLDAVSPDAAALGAVNTVVFRDGVRQGFNTDWTGYLASLRRGLPGAAMRDVAQIGAGGAGSAVAYALLSNGVERLRVYDPQRAKAETLAERLGKQFSGRCIEPVPSPAAALDAADGVVQTSPIGMESHPGLPFSADYLRPDMWVSDIVYFPIETQLLRAARRLGCQTLNGGGMAVHQAADAFRLMTGIEPSVERMLEAFQERPRTLS
ncbi:MAG: shikimate dehydrogenase [Steroidobacteraceae bacterium]